MNSDTGIVMRIACWKILPFWLLRFCYSVRRQDKCLKLPSCVKRVVNRSKVAFYYFCTFLHTPKRHRSNVLQLCRLAPSVWGAIILCFFPFLSSTGEPCPVFFCDTLSLFLSIARGVVSRAFGRFVLCRRGSWFGLRRGIRNNRAG